MMRTLVEEVRQIERRFGEALLSPFLATISRALDSPAVDDYLAQVKAHILDHLDDFKEEPAPSSPLPLPPFAQGRDAFVEYDVNVVVDNAETQGAPVLVETSPTYLNLFGTIERVWDRSGQWRTDFTKIKAGSLLRADGGFLVMNALDLFLEPGVWPTLKRALRNQEVEIQSYDPFSMLALSAIKPEAIAIDVKVILIGDPEVYEILYAFDEEFPKLFKIRADFDWEMKNSPEAIAQYATLIKTLCGKEQLRPFDSTGVAAAVEFGARLAGRANKVSTRFNVISDLLKEADYWAAKENAPRVEERHVDKAIAERIDRASLLEEKLQNMIDEGLILIDTTGSVVGQVNGLAVYDTGELTFGKPSRITAKVAVGSSGIINIEREAQLSGRIHDKGVLILSGFLRDRFAQHRPLAMSASICFEQSYSGVEGDSASSTEVYALLSALSGLPIRQDLAVTGSVNQKGEIQPIGGVNQKIEGFYDVCRAKGLTGTQGVLIPVQNVGDLMLRKDVVAAVEQDKFAIYAVSTIEQGIELLTGWPAGTPDESGRYPRGSVYALVDARLEELARKWQEFRKTTEE
ncbi:MAG: AAA family ATPase [candidate division WOR-3 bacterium]